MVQAEVLYGKSTGENLMTYLSADAVLKLGRGSTFSVNFMRLISVGLEWKGQANISRTYKMTSTHIPRSKRKAFPIFFAEFTRCRLHM